MSPQPFNGAAVHHPPLDPAVARRVETVTALYRALALIATIVGLTMVLCAPAVLVAVYRAVIW